LSFFVHADPSDEKHLRIGIWNCSKCFLLQKVAKLKGFLVFETQKTHTIFKLLESIKNLDSPNHIKIQKNWLDCPETKNIGKKPAPIALP
jgi:hypothetical protein